MTSFDAIVMGCYVNKNIDDNNNNNNKFISREYHIWHECQSNIWSSDTKTYMCLIITDRTKIIYSMTERAMSPYIEHAASGLPNPTPVEEEVRLIQAQDQQMLPHVVREW